MEPVTNTVASKEIEDERAEARFIDVYMELTGAPESQARSAYIDCDLIPRRDPNFPDSE